MDETKARLDPLLPQAGESLGEQIDDLLISKVFFWALMFGVFFAIALMEWRDYFFPSPPHPYFMTMLLLLVGGIAYWQIQKIQPQLHNLRLGYYGERLVAETLDSLKERGYRVFHDVQGKGPWNIDHVIIGPGGVFAIQTKMLSKRKRNSKITYDGQRILVNGLEMERDTLAQAKAGAKEIKSILHDQTALNVWVTPVILFPDWFVNPPPQNAEVYVANLKWFMKSFDKEHAAVRLESTKIEQLANGLRRYSTRA